MSNPYYTVTGAPATQSRGVSATIRSEYGLIAAGFDGAYAAILLRGLKAGETWTGAHSFTGATVTFATQAASDNSTKAATTAYADAAVAALAAIKADIASPTFTGTPAAPTAAAGTSTTQIATTEFVANTAFSSALPAQTGNSGKFVTTNGTTASWALPIADQTGNSGKFLTTNGTTSSWAAVLASGVTSVTTATTATTLTSTATLLQITPTSYGVAVTLPDATTCSVGGPLHIIDNKGAYPVRVLNSAGTLLGFVFGGVVSHVSLVDNSTAAGTWTIENNELVGASAQLLTTTMSLIDAVIDIGSNQEVIIGRGVSSANCYGVVYNRSTNTFGSVTLIRTATFGSSLISACLSGTNQVLVCSVATGATSFEAVALSISGTTITVNTAATATLSANISTFADGCGLIAVGSSFVCSYTVSGPAAQIRALSISGTTVTIGSASVLDGTAGGLIAAAASHVVAASTATTHLYTKPYLVSGSSLTAGTGTDTNSGTMTLNKLAALGARWYVGYNDGGTAVMGGVVSLNASGNGTTTISTATLFSAGALADAMTIGSNKVLVLNDQTTNNANIITDTAGTASAGTAITLDGNSTRICLYTYDSTAVVVSGNSNVYTSIIDCSGTSPVLTKRGDVVGASFPIASVAASNSVLSRSPTKVFGASFTQNVTAGISATYIWSLRVEKTEPSLRSPLFRPLHIGSTHYRGRSASEVWVTDTTSVVTKMECVA